MDLNKLDVVKFANEGSVLELLHPVTGEVLTDDSKKPKAFYLRLLGSDSDAYRNALNRRFEQTQNSKKKAKIDLDVAKRKGAELLARCTTECFMIEDGKVIEYSKNEMIRLYLKYPWMREQAEDFMSDRGNLIKS